MAAGFIPFSRASFSLDLIATSLAVVLPLLTYSVLVARRRKAYQLHKRLQIALGTALLVAVLLFEIDMRSSGWREAAAASPYYDSLVTPMLILHLCFSVPALLLWLYTIFAALRHFPKKPTPNAFSSRHKRMGYWAMGAMYGTAITGWMFYWLAFVS